MNMRRRCLIWALAVSGLIFATRVVAEEWDNPLGGEFVDSGNWLFGIVPDESEDANYLLPNNYTITFPQLAFSATVNVRNGNVIFDIPEIPAMGTYDINLLLIGQGGIPLMNPPSASLTISGGHVNVQTAVEIYKGATLRGDGEIFSFGPTIYHGGLLTGTLHVIGSTTFNQGTVAPGTGVGVLQLTSDYFQAADGSLEIEIGGTVPGLQHDQLPVSGSAQLSGKLYVPFVMGYTPSTMHNLSILTASSVTGQFSSLSFPNIGPSGLAVQVNYGATGVTLGYVNPVTVGVNSAVLAQPPAPPHNYWNNTNFWPGASVPNSTNVVNLFNSQSSPRIIELDSQVPGAKSAITHQVILGGSSNTMTLLLRTGTDFTAVKSMSVGNRGVLELAGGTAHSNEVAVSSGGLVRGNGTIDGNLQLGTTSGSVRAVLSPGFSSGQIRIEDNLTIGQNGAVTIEIFGETDFDKVIVGQDANLGGTMVVDISNALDPMDILNTPLAVLTAGDVNFEFNDFELMDDEDGFFIYADYSTTEVALSVGMDGDMNFNEGYDAADIQLFALGLTNELGYIQAVQEYPIGPGDMNGDSRFDFDDIALFSLLPFGGGITADDVLEYLIAGVPLVPEPGTPILVAIAFILFGSRRCVMTRPALL